MLGIAQLLAKKYALVIKACDAEVSQILKGWTVNNSGRWEPPVMAMLTCRRSPRKHKLRTARLKVEAVVTFTRGNQMGEDDGGKQFNMELHLASILLKQPSGHMCAFFFHTYICLYELQ